MAAQSLKKTLSIALTALLLLFTNLFAQEPELKVSRPASTETAYQRATPTLELERDSAFRRLQAKGNNPVLAANAEITQSRSRLRMPVDKALQAEKIRTAATVPQSLPVSSLGTGSGDIDEIEPNDQVAQGIALPVNVFGTISFNGDLDYFAFQAFAGQPVVVEAFAARLSHSNLFADIALFNSAGQQLARSIGDALNDPLIRYTPTSDGVLVVGIADVDDFGGANYTYMLNIVRGADVDEIEPNDRKAQNLPALPLTVFGDIGSRNDVDFYSFTADAGQTLIVDVDAEVLGSALDSEINLSDPSTGVEYFYNNQLDGHDSRFNIVLPYTGRYVVGIGSFNNNSSGVYRLNLSLVPQSGAPLITGVTRISKKLLEVTGTGFADGTSVEVNSDKRRTTRIAPGVLRAKVKARTGNVVTVSNPPDGRRSNPMLVQ